MKRIKLIPLLLVVGLLLAGCNQAVYQSDTVKVETVAPLAEPVETYTGSGIVGNIIYSEEKLFGENVVALQGVAKNVREVKVTVQHRIEVEPGKVLTDESESYVTLFDLHISEVILNNGEALPKVVTVGIEWSSRDVPLAQMNVEEGCSCVVFARRTKDLNNDSRERSGYSDLWGDYLFMKLTSECTYVPYSVNWLIQELMEDPAYIREGQPYRLDAQYLDPLMDLLRQLGQKHAK